MSRPRIRTEEYWKQFQKDYYKKHKERLAMSNREWVENNKKTHKEYQRKYREAHKKQQDEYMRKYLGKNQHKTKTRVESSKIFIELLPCVVCKEPKSHRHHPDYKKSYSVIFLCRKHHLQVHRLSRRLGNDIKEYNTDKKVKTLIRHYGFIS